MAHLQGRVFYLGSSPLAISHWTTTFHATFLSELSGEQFSPVRMVKNGSVHMRGSSVTLWRDEEREGEGGREGEWSQPSVLRVPPLSLLSHNGCGGQCLPPFCPSLPSVAADCLRQNPPTRVVCVVVVKWRVRRGRSEQRSAI